MPQLFTAEVKINYRMAPNCVNDKNLTGLHLTWIIRKHIPCWASIGLLGEIQDGEG